jgi:hypothetical protein
MTDHDNNAAAVLPERRTPNAERCPVVDLVTLSTNLKTEDLKTVTPKNIQISRRSPTSAAAPTAGIVIRSGIPTRIRND